MILCVVFALCVGLYIGWRLSGREEARWVEVYQTGRLVYSAPLSNSRTLRLEGNLVSIDGNGGAQMTHANCPDLVCVRTGRITRVNQMITCLPNQVVVKIRGESNKGDVDAVAG